MAKVLLGKINLVIQKTAMMQTNPNLICNSNYSKNINLPFDNIRIFCIKWQVAELALFGSVLRDDFRPDSDIDLLIAFSVDADWSLFDHIKMQQELAIILERKVDLASKREIERSQNPIRRHEILSTAQVIYSRDIPVKKSRNKVGWANSMI